MERNISNVGSQCLRALLGEHFQTIMDIRPIVHLPVVDRIPGATAPLPRTIDLTGELTSAALSHRESNILGSAPHEVIDLTLDSADEAPDPQKADAIAMTHPNGNSRNSAAAVVPPARTITASRPEQHNTNSIQGPLLPFATLGPTTNAGMILPPISSMMVANPTDNEASSSSAVLPLGPANSNVHNRPSPAQRRNFTMISGDENENARNNAAFDQAQLKRLRFDTSSRNAGPP